MGSTYASINIHIVFSTKERRRLIEPSWIDRLHEYLGGCARGLGAIPLEVGGVEDHVHMMLGTKPSARIADLVRDIKSGSSGWVHDVLGVALFGWQDGYGAFSVSQSQVDNVRRYIRNQAEHHRRQTFDDEFRTLLAAHGIAPFENA